MVRITSGSEEWKALVLRSMAAPYWLSPKAVDVDIVLSTRVRALRNLTGIAFPHKASIAELESVCQAIVKATPPTFEVMKKITFAESSFYIGCRLMAPDFPYSKPGRILLLDAIRSTGVMVNEEDHLRMQVLTPGWSLEECQHQLNKTLHQFSQHLQFAWLPEWGYLASSPYNAGAGLRLSAMCHLIGLATNKKLVTVLKALSSQGLVVRGLFGETSRAIGAFVQVSVPSDAEDIFRGACEYLIHEEREARNNLSRSDITEQLAKVREYAIGSHSISLSDALRVLAWIRLGACIEIEGTPSSPRVVDSWLTTMELRSPMEEQRSAIDRASWLRTRIEAC